MPEVDSRQPGVASQLDLPTDGKPGPIVSAERTAWRLAHIDFPWDINKALEFALLRTYAVPSISSLLARTGEFVERTMKRYDDTALLIREVLRNGLDSERARRSFDRINAMHGRFRIANDDFLYVLSTFIFTPIEWLDRFGRRPMSPDEQQDWFVYWCAFGRRMKIEGIFEEIGAFRSFAREFEAARYQPAASNRLISQRTIDLLLSMYFVPPLLHPAGRQVALALCEAHLVAALGFDEPAPWLRATVAKAMDARRAILRALPPNRRVNPPALGRTTYPEGYNIEELGTFPRRF